MYGFNTSFYRCSSIKTPLIFDIYIVSNIGGNICFFSALCGRKGEISMDCTEAYKAHIMYFFNGFCKVVIRYVAINAWRDRNRRRQREISFEYLTEEKFYPLSTSDEYLKSLYEQYPVTICVQTIILTNGEFAAAEFIRQALIKSSIHPVITVSPVNDELLSAVGKLTAEYGKTGGNFNQIARCLNEYGAPYNALSHQD